MDDVSETNIAALEAVARDYLAQPNTRKQLKRLATLL
jgi:hypothetical protein